MNTDPVCEICRIKITYDKASFKLTCCNKNICSKCGEELTKKPRDPCPKCIKNLSLEKDIKLHQKIIQKEFDEIEPKINSHHLNNFKNHQKNLEKIHNYYTQQRDLQDFNTLNNTIRILRKDQDIKMTGYVNQVCTFQTKFRDFANKIKSPEFYHNNLDEAIDLINEYKIFFKFKIEIEALSSTKIHEFCQTSLTNALNEKSLESLKFLLDYKDLINEHFTRNYFLLNNYQEFFKLLKENFEPVFENKWPVTPDMLTKRLKSKIENDEKFIKILLEVKLMHIETERTKLFNVLKHIYELIDTFYEEIRDLKETNQVKYDEVVFKIEHFLKYEFIDVELNSEMLEDFFYFENLIQKCSFKNFKNLFSDKFKIADYAQEVINDYVSNKDKRKTLRTLKKTGELMDTFTIGFDIAKMFSYTILIGISFANLKACPYKGFLLPLTMILLGVIGLLFTSTRFTISILSTIKRRSNFFKRNLTNYYKNRYVMALIGIFVLLTPWTAASYVVKSVSLDGDYKIRDHPLFCEEKFLSYSKMVLLLTEFGLTGFLILALFIYFMWTHWAKKNIKIQMRKNVEQNSVNVLYTIMGDYIKIDKSNYKDSFFIPNNGVLNENIRSETCEDMKEK